ncbi:interleukin-2 [Bos indicus]|uniref:Interleukin-2 n=14 Tax=Bovinae TaxID=27592 RepID=IL2_BOVIN|nr:interleukin-2 precursor [Bos taurus]XP_005908401.1 PREDICTED: interleukin-2 isoform X1 [Bos mutus]XP_010858579.1 PREDICTED: interleukin-2 [Bison bison bison]XP_027369343.1 interleukin-2 [Bos indicus x Bos taurus]XP_061240246.1 interleukin-2 [Bos javanicus]P05016.1 RecName: Full=Interleukin-2; Short=IL-2; AltName: Full=T-cell growth factor; Short=TCGF; Flags: Precursor [Bos taurus]ABK41608.1 interleukin-2 [Bos indicus]ABO69917.1 interleukin 2 [Bos gaurus]ABO69918.1 interleukin 2 [Bubalus 
MYKIQLLSCIALTLALVANGAPTSSSTGNTMKEVKSLLLDLQLLLEKVKNPENLKLSRMHTFDFYVPKVNATELKHLKCLLEELKLLEEVLNLAPSKNLNPREIKDSMDNIKRIVLELQGSETRFTCEYDDATVNAVEFLNKWITFCQSIYSTMT